MSHGAREQKRPLLVVACQGQLWPLHRHAALRCRRAAAGGPKDLRPHLAGLELEREVSGKGSSSIRQTGVRSAGSSDFDGHRQFEGQIRLDVRRQLHRPGQPERLPVRRHRELLRQRERLDQPLHGHRLGPHEESHGRLRAREERRLRVPGPAGPGAPVPEQDLQGR